MTIGGTEQERFLSKARLSTTECGHLMDVDCYTLGFVSTPRFCDNSALCVFNAQKDHICTLKIL